MAEWGRGGVLIPDYFQAGKRLRRSCSTGSGDKLHREQEAVASAGLAEIMMIQTVPDIFSSLVVSGGCSLATTANNNQAGLGSSEAKIINDFEEEFAGSEDSFDPGTLGLMENPGIVRFDSLDYPDFCDSFSEDDNDDNEDDEVDSEAGAKLFQKILRFSCDSLIGRPIFKQRKLATKQRAKSLSDIHNLETCQIENSLFRGR